MSKNIKKYMLAALLVLAAFLCAAVAYPIYEWVRIPENRTLIWERIDALGPWGAGIFLCIQILQVVIALIPGEPVELAAGMLYGTWGGLLICLAGILIGSSVIFTLVRRFGQPLVRKLIHEEDMKKYAFLSDAQKLDMLIFLVFLIPGTPKDTLNYLCPLTPISPVRFLILSTFARIPSVLSSTFAGANFAQGNLIGSALSLCLTTLVGILGIRYENTLIQWMNQHTSRLRNRMNNDKSQSENRS